MSCAVGAELGLHLGLEPLYVEFAQTLQQKNAGPSLLRLQVCRKYPHSGLLLCKYTLM